MDMTIANRLASSAPKPMESTLQSRARGTDRRPGEALVPTAVRRSKQKTAATFGGAGWVSRRGLHVEDVAAGRLWTKCGVSSETGRLRAVLLVSPGEELRDGADPNARLMLAPVNVRAIQRQARGIAKVLREHGITVHVFRPPNRPPPNLIFMRDLFFMTPEGAVLSRVGASQRAGEERFAAAALASIGIPILGIPRSNATVEGADVLWAREDLALIGIGKRTNAAGADFVTGLLSGMGARTRSFQLPQGSQHLLGIANFVSETLVVVRKDQSSKALLRALHSLDFEVLELPASTEVVERRALGFICVEPMRIICHAGCPVTRRTLEAHGVHVTELCASEYVKAAGSLACLTGVLHRDGRSPKTKLSRE
jgi:N-dimethylarginine dimethylaminohydrolase